MRNNSVYYPDPSAYPGAYEPFPWREKELMNELNKPGARIVKPKATITEFSTYYRIELPVPGFDREDFIIHSADGRVLSIIAANKSRIRKRQPEGSACKYIRRDIVLPADADTDFVAAEYRTNILCICLFKTLYPAMNRPGYIIVY